MRDVVDGVGTTIVLLSARSVLPMAIGSERRVEPRPRPKVPGEGLCRCSGAVARLLVWATRNSEGRH